jgi:hypothetical protein
LKKNWQSTKRASRPWELRLLKAKPMMMNRTVSTLKPMSWMGFRPTVSHRATVTQ